MPVDELWAALSEDDHDEIIRQVTTPFYRTLPLGIQRGVAEDLTRSFYLRRFPTPPTPPSSGSSVLGAGVSAAHHLAEAAAAAAGGAAMLQQQVQQIQDGAASPGLVGDLVRSVQELGREASATTSAPPPVSSSSQQPARKGWFS